eukprot:gene12288-15442_t
MAGTLNEANTSLQEVSSQSRELPATVVAVSADSCTSTKTCAPRARTNTQVTVDDSDDEDDEMKSHARQIKIDDLFKAWSPYRHMNGVSVYLRDDQTVQTEGKTGGEYMVSCVIQGKPNDVLGFMMQGSFYHGRVIQGEESAFAASNRSRQSKQLLHLRVVPSGWTGLLCAPLLHFRVVPSGWTGLLCTPLLHFRVVPSGWTGLLCAPREFYVERFYMGDDARMYVIMFNSVAMPKEEEEVMGEDGVMRAVPGRFYKGSDARMYVIMFNSVAMPKEGEEVMGEDGVMRAVPGIPSPKEDFARRHRARGFWKKPVVG